MSGCAQLATHPALVGLPLPPLVPVHSYVAPLDGNGGYQISPDGKRLAWLARAGFGPSVFVKDLGTGEARLVQKGAATLVWADDSRHLLLVSNRGGDENAHIHQVDTTSTDRMPGPRT